MDIVGLLIGVLVVGVLAIIFANFYDHIIVAVIYTLHLNVCPMARQIAMLLYQYPEQWTGDKYHLSHPKVGAIWIANEAYGLKIQTEFGDLKPNVIERRLIRDAVDWRLRGYIRHRLTAALSQSVTGRIVNVEPSRDVL